MYRSFPRVYAVDVQLMFPRLRCLFARSVLAGARRTRALSCAHSPDWNPRASTSDTKVLRRFSLVLLLGFARTVCCFILVFPWLRLPAELVDPVSAFMNPLHPPVPRALSFNDRGERSFLGKHCSSRLSPDTLLSRAARQGREGGGGVKGSLVLPSSSLSFSG